jgi:two-component system sensor histidine kinase NblS
MNKTEMTIQSKLIFLGLIVSTIFIICIALFSTINIQNRLNEGYENFGKIISKTLAVETVDLISNISGDKRYLSLKEHSGKILENNSDIAFIDFFDNDGKILYSSKDDYKKQAKYATIIINSPMVSGLSKKETVGSVSVGLSGGVITKITNTIRTSLILVFLLVWICFALVIMVNSYLTTRELRILKNGVKRISTGEFGHKIKDKDVSVEVKQLFESFNDMSNRLHIYEQQNIEQLTLEKNKLEAILMNIANGVIVCDENDKITLMNYQAQKLLKASEKDLLNTKIQLFTDANGNLCFKDKINFGKNNDKSSEPFSVELNINDKVVKTLISPMLQGYIIVLIDMTKEAEVDKLRGQFISNVSHELRTPVTVLRTYIDTLYNYGNDFDFNTQKEFIGTINDEIIRLHNLVNDILDFSRLDASNVKLEKDYYNIQEMVESCVKSVDILAKDKNITFSIMKEDNLPAVYMNEDSIFRALKNLLSNAIKYSPENDKIKVKTELARKKGYIEISVEDNGIGIAPEYQEKIFDRFFRVENDTHTIKGTGLGLHLVKMTIEKHHKGEVFVNSEPGKGSTFGFIIPIEPVDEEVTV